MCQSGCCHSSPHTIIGSHNHTHIHLVVTLFRSFLKASSCSRRGRLAPSASNGTITVSGTKITTNDPVACAPFRSGCAHAPRRVEEEKQPNPITQLKLFNIVAILPLSAPITAGPPKLQVVRRGSDVARCGNTIPSRGFGNFKRSASLIHLCDGVGGLHRCGV